MTEILPFAKYIAFKDLFVCDSDATYKVPPYQRHYDWGKPQHEDLFKDLERMDKLAKKPENNASHFCGTIICTRSDNQKFLNVVDGQQRLTTLVMLHVALCRKMHKQSFTVRGHHPRFTPQTPDNQFFKKLLLSKPTGDPLTVSQKKYQDTIVNIEAWLVKIGNGCFESMLHHIEYRLQFILLVLEGEAEVARVFEAINNRGKPLTQMDLVKNHLIYISQVRGWPIETVTEAWREIQQSASATTFRKQENQDTILRATVQAMYEPGKRASGETDHMIIANALTPESEVARNSATPNDDEGKFIQFLSFLSHNFETFRVLRDANRSGNNRAADRQLIYLNQHSTIAGVLPLIFAASFTSKNLGGYASDLEAIERANFRLYGLPQLASRADSYNVRLHRIAHMYLTRSTDSDVEASFMTDELSNLVRGEQKDGMRTIVKALSLDDDNSFDFYHWDGLRYFLGRWEESLREKQDFNYAQLDETWAESMSGGKSNNYLAKEHILATNDQGKPELKAIGEYNNNVLRRRLGNFMLLAQGLNVSVSDDEVASKVDTIQNKNNIAKIVQNTQLDDYAKEARKITEAMESTNKFFRASRDTDTKYNSQTTQPNREVVFAKALCDLREEDMIAFALKAWRLDGERANDKIMFKGVFSFSYHPDCSTFKSSSENGTSKFKENFVLSAGVDLRDNRMAERDRLLKRSPPSVFWN